MRKEQVKVAFEKLEAEQQIGKVRLHDDQASADEENKEAPEEQAMGYARALDSEHLALQQHTSNHVANPDRQLI